MSIAGKIRPLGGIALTAVLVSCSANLEVYRYDNPDIRRRQSEQLDRTLPSVEERERMMRFIGPRVGFLVRGEHGEPFDPRKISVASGRAACI